jgi:DNA-binding transcriptional ArsR family regulator
MDRGDDERTWDTLVRLYRHPLRWHALFQYEEQVTSPRAVAAILDVPLNVISYHTQVLLSAGAIELVRTERRRGAIEHFYRAVTPLEIEDEEWRKLPVKLRRVLARRFIDGVKREYLDALTTGGIDHESAHLSRTYLGLDEQGERELASLLRETLVQANAIRDASRERDADTERRHEVVVMSFERASSP